jgi:hypothetical protein
MFFIGKRILVRIKINRGILRSAKNKKASIELKLKLFMWALRDSNPGPPACKAGALNQLS